MTNIKEMQQALIKQGLTLAQVSGMSEEQLRAACSKKLRESLCGNIEGGNQDQFSKNLQYNLEFSQDGEKIKVAKLLTQTLPSRRKIEAFVDVAGNQYFQYRAADDSIIKEDYFKKAEKIGKLERFQVQDGKLVALNMFGTPKTIYDGEQVFDATMHNEWENKTPAYVINKKIKDDQNRAALSSRPEVTASYTDLMRSIEFSKASKEKQFDMLIEDSSKRFYEAYKQDNKKEMAKFLLNGMSLECQKIDMKLGITQTKDFVKKYSGLNTLVDAIDKWMDDGDASNLSNGERWWNAVKAIGKVADSFVGTQGVITVAAFAAAVKAAVASATAAGGVAAGKLVMLAIQAYFGYEGTSMVIEGMGDVINAKTEEEAQEGGSKIAMGGIMLYGTYKTFKAGYKAYKANKLAMQEQQALMDGAKKVLDIPEGTEITETVLKDAYRKAALKTHPDKGGSVEAFDAVTDAYNLLKGTTKVTVTSPTTNTKTSAAVKPASITSVSKYSECQLPATMQNVSGNIGNVTVKVASGDMTRIKADALCVPEFPNCASEGGVGYAVMRSGATKGVEAYHKLATAENGGQGYDFGTAVITKSGGGNSPNLVHVVTAGAKADNQFAVVQQSVYNALKQAESQGLKSVAMPALGTGIIGSLTGQQSAQAMMAGIKQFSDGGGKMDVSLVVYGSGSGYNSFVSTMKTGSYADAVPQQGAREFDAGRWLASMTNGGEPVPPTEVPKVSTAKANGVNPTLAKQITKAAQKSEYDANVVTDMMQKYPDIVDKLTTYKAPDGTQLLNAQDISDILYNCKSTIETNPDRMFAVLNNPKEVADIAGYNSRGGGVWRAIGDPLQSTIDANPALFGAKAKATTPQTTKPSMIVTRPNGAKVDVMANVPQGLLEAPTEFYLSMPKATTVEPNFGVTIKQAKASPVEAKRIVFANTVEETLRINNENGIPLKFEANPEAGEAPYFYKDAPYGGRQKVNTRSVEVTYTHEATADWGLTPEYVKEYADSKGFCPDRAVVAAGDDAATGLKGNIAEKQYEVVNPDGTRSPLVVDDLKPGQVINIIKKEGVELKMAVFDKPTVSLEGETLPAGKLMMVDSEGHPYNGNPVKRLKSGEVEFDFDMNDPRQAQIKADLDAVVKLEVDAKTAKKDGNKDLAGQLNTQAKELTGKLETELTDFVKAEQNPQQNNSQLIADLKANARIIIKDPKNIPVVENMLNKHIDLVKQLSELKMPDGTPRFTLDDLNSMLLNIEENDWNNPNRIFKAIEEADKYGYGPGAFGVWKCLYY